MVENIEKVSERVALTEMQKISMLESAWILEKALSVGQNEWLKDWRTRLMHEKSSSKDCDRRNNDGDKNNNNDNDSNNDNNNNNKL